MAPIDRRIFFATVVTFCSIYAAQPIQPLFQSEFQLSNFQAILFTTLMMAPLGIAPLLYGYLLESYSARRMVRGALLVLGVLELLFAFADNYLTLLVIRAVQGLMVPAIITSLMSYISYTTPQERMQQAVSLYIAATITGGFLGRFLSGLCTDLFGWRFFFFLLGLFLLWNAGQLRVMVKDAKLHYARPRLAEILLLLRDGRFFWSYAAIFCLFFVFAGLMNFLPFELKRIDPDAGATGIGLLYLGYSMGFVVTLNARRITLLSGGPGQAITAGIVVYGLGTLFFLVEVYSVMFLGMFVFCAGLFTAHSLLSGLVNTLARENRAMANGLYISLYYTGGTLGSFLPGAVFQYFGWQAFVAQLLVMIFLALLCTLFLRAAVNRQGAS